MDKPALGGERFKLQCSNCGNDVIVVDRDIMDFGPIRCGACGEPVQGAQLQHLIDDVLPSGTRH